MGCGDEARHVVRVCRVDMDKGDLDWNVMFFQICFDTRIDVRHDTTQYSACPFPAWKAKCV